MEMDRETLLEALLARPLYPDASSQRQPQHQRVAVAEAAVAPEEGQEKGEEDEDEALPSAWDPSDWWGEDEEAAARRQDGSGGGAGLPPPPTLECEALSSRRPPPNPQPSPLPRPWNPEGSGPYHATLSADRLTARYLGKGANHAQDVGTVKADRPLPRTRDYYYFEVEVLSTASPSPPSQEQDAAPAPPPGGVRANICIGLATRGFPLHRHAGTSPYNGGGTGPVHVPLRSSGADGVHVCASYAYRGTDGRVQAHVSHSKGPSGAAPSIVQSVRGKDYGPGFAPGDVVGCGVDFMTQEVFFTKNGQHLGAAFEDIYRQASPSSSSPTNNGPTPPQRPQQPQQQQRGNRARAYSTSWVSSSGVAPASGSIGGSGGVSILRSHTRGGAAPAAASPPSSVASRSASASASAALQAALTLRAALRATLLAAGNPGAEAAAAAAAEGAGERGSQRGRAGREERSASFSSSSGSGHYGRRTDPSALYETGSGAGGDPWLALPPNRLATASQRGAAQASGASGASSGPPAAAVPLLPSPQLDLYPVVSLHGANEAVRANFGQRPFRFDVAAWWRERQRQRQPAQQGEGRGSSTGVAGEAVHALVRDYLAVRGYAKTLGKFEAAVGAGGDKKEEELEGESNKLPALVRKRRRAACGDLGLEERVAMRRLVMAEGEEEQVLARLGPQAGGALGFELRCLAFVARLWKGDVAGALAYAQRELGPYLLRGPGSSEEKGEGEDSMDVCEVEDGPSGKAAEEARESLALAARVRDVMGLLAYPDISAAPPSLARLASPAQRARVADMVNAALLEAAAAAATASRDGAAAGGAANGSAVANGKAAAAEDGAGVVVDADPSRPLLERVLVHLAAAREAVRDAKADGRGSPFKLPALLVDGGGVGKGI